MDYSKIFATWWLGVCYHKEQLDELLSSTDIRGSAWILHDKDIEPDTNKPKKPHYHFLVQFTRNQRGSWFGRFATDDLGILFPKPCKDPQAAFDYLIHDTQAARADGKYLYDPSERHSTLTDFTPSEETDNKKIDSLKLRKLIFDDCRTPSEILLEHNLTNQQIALADRLYSEYKSKTLKDSLRLDLRVHYLYGAPRTGKTSYVYKQHNPSDFYRVTNYKNPFDNYAYQPILVLDEFDGQGQLDIEYVNNLLDIYPCELACRFYNKWAAWTTVYVISNLPLILQYQRTAAEKKRAFQERFHEIKCFDNQKKTVEQLKALSESESEQLGFESTLSKEE